MLPDYKQTLYAPLKFKHVHIVVLQVTFGGGNGTPTLDTVNSSPSILPNAGNVAGNVGISGTAGNYTLNIPKGQFLHFVGGEWSVPSAAGAALTPVIVDATGNPSASAGTVNLQTINAAGGAGTPANSSRLYLTFLIGKA